MSARTEAGPTAPRRTQAERRESTVHRLVEATTGALIEVGYSRTSVQEICSRAGLTQGALFRHFSSRIELLIRVADEIGDGLLELYRRDFERLRGRRGRELVLALELLRSNVRSRLHEAWFELLMAARTDAILHQALVPIWARRDALTLQLASSIMPEAARLLPDFAVIVDTLVTLFHGEAIDRFLRDDPRADERRMAWLLGQLQPLLDRASAS
ncbi:MAG: TetR/AcrR family transcriptional regulator [Nevskia sp.]